MKSFDYYRNKNVLGELTLRDLIEAVPIEGDFTIGQNWLPIVRTRVSRKRDTLNFFMDSLSSGDSEIEISLDTKVVVADNMVSMRIPWVGRPDGRLFRIRLDSVPVWFS